LYQPPNIISSKYFYLWAISSIREKINRGVHNQPSSRCHHVSKLPAAISKRFALDFYNWRSTKLFHSLEFSRISGKKNSQNEVSYGLFQLIYEKRPVATDCRHFIMQKFSEFNWRLMCFQLGDDYVNITNDTGSFGSWTGSENPPQIQSSATLLVALQTSDDGTLNPGYLANYSQKDRSENEVTRNESFYACCSTLSSGNVTSPGYPNAYPNRLRYSWIIVQPLGCVIQLNFSDFLGAESTTHRDLLSNSTFPQISCNKLKQEPYIQTKLNVTDAFVRARTQALLV
ncbi:hypothetical protein T265_15578, partial [Opisthorchis viverrini]